jgi:hypothetical protein
MTRGLQLPIFSLALCALTGAAAEGPIQKPDPAVVLRDLRLAPFTSPGVFSGPLGFVEIALPTHRAVVVQRVGYQVRSASGAKPLREDFVVPLSSSFWNTSFVLSLKRDIIELH